VVQLGALVLVILSGRNAPLNLLVLVIYMGRLFLLNGMLTSEFVRKTQLEADQIAEQIQRTLHPQTVAELPGYRLEMFCKALFLLSRMSPAKACRQLCWPQTFRRW
jgi:hypothetical protein